MVKRRMLLEGARTLAESGLSHGRTGNLSLRIEGGMLITPSGVPYHLLREADLVELSLDGTPADPLARPSSEWAMHAAIYRHHPGAKAVVHCHSDHATALACLRRGIPPFHYMVLQAGGPDIRCSDYATFGTEALSEAAVRALEGRHACLLANHGQVALGPTLALALELAETVEHLARQYLLALQGGEPVLLSEQEMTQAMERFGSYNR